MGLGGRRRGVGGGLQLAVGGVIDGGGGVCVHNTHSLWAGRAVHGNERQWTGGYRNWEASTPCFSWCIFHVWPLDMMEYSATRSGSITKYGATASSHMRTFRGLLAVGSL